MARTLIHIPPSIRSGEPFEVRTTIAHPMETGFRPDENGRVLPRDIVSRMHCTLDGALVFSAELFPAIAANPYVAFQVRAERSGLLRITWEGDNGFAQTETVAVQVA